jgi:hypothetical protein
MIKLSTIARRLNETTEKVAPVESDDFNALVKILESEDLRTEYTKLLTIFNAFDPNSVGTISEILLTKAINKYAKSADVEAKHTGASGGLSDLKLIVSGKEIGISLKTTGDNPINLGSDTTNANKFPDLDELKKYQGRTINDIKDSGDAELYKICSGRVKAVALKLSGAGDDELFLWINKFKPKSVSIISGVQFNVVKFKQKPIINYLENECTINVSPKGWGLFVGQQPVIANASYKDKYLNIHPKVFSIGSILSGMGGNYKSINVPLIDESKFKNAAEFQAKVQGLPDKIVDAFVNLYDELFV